MRAGDGGASAALARAPRPRGLPPKPVIGGLPARGFGQTGLTLVELVCAVALLGLLMTCLATVLSTTVGRVEDVTRRGRLLRRAAGLVDLLEADLRCAADNRIGEKCLALKPGPALPGAGPLPRLTFLTVRAYAAPAAPELRLYRVRYEIQPAEGDSLRLVRAEWSYDALPPEKRADPPEEQARRVTLAQDLRSWRVEVLRKDAWQAEDEGGPRLPRAVRIDFEIGAGAPEAGRVVVAWPE